jgi:UTP--glucose-1-phosphate uridylyltransferase
LQTTIKKCLFPAAGYGTRFLPATKAIPKEMLPVLTKPLLQYGVEEAIEAGLNTMAIVTGRGKRAIEDHFDISYELEHQIKDTAKESYLTEIRRVITNCTFSYTRQIEMKGLGHAILTGETLIGQEPFAVILADDLCDNDEDGVLAQMVKLYEKYKCSIVAVEEVPLDETNKYGVVEVEDIKLLGEVQPRLKPGFREQDASKGSNAEEGVTKSEDGIDSRVSSAEEGVTKLEDSIGSKVLTLPKESIFKVTNMVEKPDPKDAPSNLAIIGRYILTPDIFDILRETKPGKGGEIQITDALLEQAKQGKVIAYKFQGKRFDCGSVDGFVEATNYFYQKREQ